MMKPDRPNESTVGIMTTQTDEHPPFANRGFYRRLCILGSRSGLTVFVFTPQGIDWSRPQVTGYVYDAALREWVSRTFDLPAIVYDRCFFTVRRQYADYRNALHGLQRQPSVRLLGCGLKGKWDVQQALRRDGRFDRHLPETQPLRSMRTLADWLRRRGEAILKPRGGSQGRGVLLVRRESASPAGTANAAGAAFTVRGRDPRN
ncbi:YheC/YheD family protein, partial [Paenibacillus ehimensis]